LPLPVKQGVRLVDEAPDSPQDNVGKDGPAPQKGHVLLNLDP